MASRDNVPLTVSSTALLPSRILSQMREEEGQTGVVRVRVDIPLLERRLITCLRARVRYYAYAYLALANKNR